MKSNVIGGGWMDTSVSGEKYLRLSFRVAVAPKVTYMMFKNKKKAQENSPDYLVYAISKQDGKEPEDEGMF